MSQRNKRNDTSGLANCIGGGPTRDGVPMTETLREVIVSLSRHSFPTNGGHYPLTRIQLAVANNLNFTFEVGTILNRDARCDDVANHMAGLMNFDALPHGDIPVYGALNYHSSRLNVSFNLTFRAHGNGISLHIQRAFKLAGDHEILTA